MIRLRKIRDFLGDTRERWFFFHIDWHKRRQQWFFERSRFWHRAAARRVARRLMKHGLARKISNRDGDESVMAPPAEIAAHVLREVGGYDVTTYDVLVAHRIPSVFDRLIDRTTGD